jgi:hypothetical protein
MMSTAIGSGANLHYSGGSIPRSPISLVSSSDPITTLTLGGPTQMSRPVLPVVAWHGPGCPGEPEGRRRPGIPSWSATAWVASEPNRPDMRRRPRFVRERA